LSANFKGNRELPTNDCATNDCWCQKTRDPGLSRGVVLHDPTFRRFDIIPACDTQTDTRWQQVYRASTAPRR